MTPAPAIIPYPLELTPLAGAFVWSAKSRIVCHGAGTRTLGDLLAGYLALLGAGSPAVVEGPPRRGDVVLALTGRARVDDAGFSDEAYTCRVEPGRCHLAARSLPGLACAVQTLRQLLPLRAGRARGPLAIPAVTIADHPRFRWRGMHLDVSRHFFTVEQVCRFIDLLALHRFNRVHLHLTDDQGWRVEIKRYPRLTEVGATRPATLVGHESRRPRVYDETPYGGFYTQEELRLIVEFARRRQIELVPEIDMPGHMQAAIAAYPELGTLAPPLRPRCHWGISTHILNVEPSTIRFMQHVLEEVMDLFPGRFIHVGGDEALKQEWSESPRIQQRMRVLGCRDEHELQSWFIRQMASCITARGRRLIGWDEILEGGLAPGAAVMSWRGETGGIAAVQQGHDVVMAPQQFVYFDHYQAEPKAEEPLAIGGLSTTEHVYAYEPVPESLTPAQQRHVLGAQGQLWTEYIGDVATLDRMAFPRACALAEVLWLPAARKQVAGFLARLQTHRKRLNALGVNLHPRP